MKRLTLLLLLVLPAGCVKSDKKEGAESAKTMAVRVYKSMDLPEKWRPLEQVRERPEMLAPKTRSTTIGKTLYVADLHEWLEKYPPLSWRWKAALRHEQEHSRRQLKKGVLGWIAKYAYDRAFMWLEEQIGWYWEIKLLRQGGHQINVPALAATLHDYKNLTGRMVSAADAVAWINLVLAGKWQPPD